jgi:hypothetical protein
MRALAFRLAFSAALVLSAAVSAGLTGWKW